MTIVALARASHPLPCLAVTVFAFALGLSTGAPPATGALLAAAVGTGQLTVGWLNDLVDVDLDTAAGRSAKPLVAGAVSRSVVRRAIVVAAAACIVLSLSLGVVPGALHLVAVGSAWAYDLRLKTTAASPLPYLVSFGLLPAIAATAAGAAVPWSVCVAAGVLGAAAHFANTVPDTVVDAATGVCGLPQRIGPRRSQLVAACGVVVACAVVVLDRGGALPPVGLAALVASSAVALGSTRAPDRLAFRLVLVAAGLAVVCVVAAG